MIFTLAFPLLALELGINGHGSWIVCGALLLAGGTAGWIMVRVEKSVDSPIIPVHLFRIRNVQLLMLIGAGIGGVMFVLIYYCPMLLQAGYGVEPDVAGLLMAPLLVGPPVGSMINGRLFRYVSSKPALLVIGTALMVAGAAGLMLSSAQSASLTLMLWFSLCGLGFGFLMPNLTLFTQMSVDAFDIGIASVAVQTLRTVGSIIATAAVGVMVSASGVERGIKLAMVMTILMCLATAWLSFKLEREPLDRKD